MSKSFYIQVRGKKQGPFTAERLRHMAKQGRFGRQHRISTNGKKWQAAEEYPELFNADGERKTVNPLRLAAMEVTALEPVLPVRLLPVKTIHRDGSTATMGSSMVQLRSK